MHMTDEEICREYREAKKPKEQVMILADQNMCEKEEILKVLQNNGYELPGTHRTKPVATKKPQTEIKEDKPKEMIKEERKAIPEAVMVAIYSRMDELDKIIAEKTKEYQQLVEFIQGGWKV